MVVLFARFIKEPIPEFPIFVSEPGAGERINSGCMANDMIYFAKVTNVMLPLHSPLQQGSGVVISRLVSWVDDLW
ncbi:hypothetical protein OSJ13_21400, partial [Mycobacterium ulcerans]